MVDTESWGLDEVFGLSSIEELVVVSIVEATGLRKLGCSLIWELVVS